MKDRFGIEINVGDIILAKDGRNLEYGVVGKSDVRSLVYSRYLYKNTDGSPYVYETTKRSSDRVIKLLPQQIKGLFEQSPELKQRFESIQKYYASQSNQ